MNLQEVWSARCVLALGRRTPRYGSDRQGVGTATRNLMRYREAQVLHRYYVCERPRKVSLKLSFHEKSLIRISCATVLTNCSKAGNCRVTYSLCVDAGVS